MLKFVSFMPLKVIMVSLVFDFLIFLWEGVGGVSFYIWEGGRGEGGMDECTRG